MSLYSVVVPVYNSEHTLGELYTRLEKVFRETLKEDGTQRKGSQGTDHTDGP